MRDLADVNIESLEVEVAARRALAVVHIHLCTMKRLLGNDAILASQEELDDLLMSQGGTRILALTEENDSVVWDWVSTELHKAGFHRDDEVWRVDTDGMCLSTALLQHGTNMT
jgi:hypothetical protein